MERKPNHRRGNPAWTKGKSGNPNGAPKKELAWSKILTSVGEESNPETKRTKRQEVARKLYEAAMQGNVVAAKLIMETEDHLYSSMQKDVKIRFSWIGEDAKTTKNNPGPI